uniref:F-box domain-containing protein n=1 Tax=Hyaloperonospora arabidopsidis (strain Emoy2) TaxID=559515 RepID=M4BJU4_HYAAE
MDVKKYRYLPLSLGTAPAQIAMAKFLSSTATLTVVVDASRLRHTRRCNGRATCSCELRIQSAFFQKTLTDIVAQGKKRRAGERRPAASVAHVTKRKYQRVSNIQQLSMELKVRISAFLAPRALGRLGMINKKFRRDVDLIAKLMMEEFLAEAPLHKLLKQERPTTTESWSQFMHKQMTCVHKIFVYYTGYKTGAMRQESPHWAFGVIDVDPNEPYCSILPNTWTFHGHTPWLQRRSNGSGGEWRLAKKYTPKKAPYDFLTHVKSWASTLRPGSLLAIAVSCYVL